MRRSVRALHSIQRSTKWSFQEFAMKAIIFPVKHRYKYWLSVAIAAAVTLGLNVALSRAALPTYPACINQATLTPVPNGVHFEYQICQVPDIDQVRTGSISPLIFG